MIAYKGFRPGLICRGYQFVMGLNTTEKANCRENGFHCAEDPLDCLSYYSSLEHSEYYIVNAGGDIDEDEHDSKIACTELTVIKRLTKEELFLHGLAYMVDHPRRVWSSHVAANRAMANCGYAVVRGKDPVATGRLGDILAFAKEAPDSESIVQVAVGRIDGVTLSKRNMIIPHVEENLDRGGFSMADTIPHVCPCCGQPTRIHESSGKGEKSEDRIIKTLYCDNPDCETRRLKKFVHFVSQKAMDIEGLSEATLEKFIGQGFIHSYLDIYRLDRYRAEIVRMDGFGEKSWQRLWDAIQQSRNTTFERYLISMDIPMIGNTASKVLGRVFHYDLDEFRDAVYGGYDFRQLPDFGETLHNNIHDWFCVEDNFCIWEELQTMMNIQKPAVAEHSEDRVQDNPFVGKTIVVTGKVEPYTRDGINDLIESLGAHAGSSVSKKTDYLVCGENAGSKLSKARDLGVTVLSPAEFFSMAGAE